MHCGYLVKEGWRNFLVLDFQEGRSQSVLFNISLTSWLSFAPVIPRKTKTMFYPVVVEFQPNILTL